MCESVVFYQRFYLVPHLRYVQTHDDLNGVAAPHHAVCAESFEDVVTLRQRHVAECDAQPRRAVVKVENVGVTAKRLQITGSLTLCGRRFAMACGILLRLIIGFAVELDFAVFAPRRFQVKTQDHRAEHQEPDAGKHQPDTNLGKDHRGVVVEHRDPVLRQERIQQAAAHIADHTCHVHQRRQRGGQ